MEILEEKDYEISDYELLEMYNQELNKYYYYLHSTGLTLEDYEVIKKVIKEVVLMKKRAYLDWYEYVRLYSYILRQKENEKDKEEYITTRDNKRAWLEQITSVLADYTKLLKLLEESIVPKTLKQYLQEECSLTHLVYTNNTNPKIKPYSLDSYLFTCQFHREKSPSLGISNGVGLGRCFACGESFNMTGYIMLYEGLSYQDTVKLLSKVYKIDIGNNDLDDSNELYTKYTNSLLSDGYRSLLLKGQERTSKKEDSYAKEISLLKYQHDLDTIDRVREDKWLKYTEDQDKPKRLVLEMPEFNK